MNVSRAFLVVGALWLIVGVGIGMYMGGSGDHALAVTHAHINLLGFTLMAIFGLAYRVFPEMADGALAVAHFWLHLVGSAVLLGLLFLLQTGRMAEAAMFPLAPLSELLVFIGVLLFFWNAFRHAR